MSNQEKEHILASEKDYTDLEDQFFNFYMSRILDFSLCVTDCHGLLVLYSFQIIVNLVDRVVGFMVNLVGYDWIVNKWLVFSLSDVMVISY